MLSVFHSYRYLPLTAALLTICSAGRQAAALQPETKLAQYAHRVWRLGDAGLLGTPQGIAQTADGYIWVSTSDGLFRFDGVRFGRWSPRGEGSLPSNSLWHLFGARNGSLYVGTDLGLARIADDRAYTYPQSPRWAGPFVEDASGTVWMGVNGAQSNPGALCGVGARSISCLGVNNGFACGRGLSNALGADGYIWIGGTDGICRWKPGSSPESFPLPGGPRQEGRISIRAMAHDADGTVWAGGAGLGEGPGLLRFANGRWNSYIANGVDGRRLSVSTLLAGREGVLWIGTADKGLLRLRKGSLDSFDITSGLSGRRVLALLEDHEGGLWVVTPAGIDYFRDYAVLSFTSSEGEVEDRAREVAADANGTVYLGSGALSRLRRNELSKVRDENGKPLGRTQFLFTDSRDDLWIASGGRLLVLRAGRTLSEIGGFANSPDDYVDSLTEDRNHDIWAAVEGLKSREAWLLEVRSERVIGRYNATPQIGDQTMNSLAPDPAGGLWAGGSARGLFHFNEGRFKRVGAAAFDDRVENMIVEPTGALWLVSPHGFVRYAEGRTKTLNATSGLPCDSGVNIHADDAGSIWFYMHCGIMRVTDEELTSWWNGSRKTIRGRIFGMLDGAHPNLFNGSPAQTPGGQLWSANGYEFQFIDVHHLPFNSLPPPVRVESIKADGRAFAPGSEINLPMQTRQVEVGYTGLSFLIPEQVRFRYRLRGHDSMWVYAGTRREAFYNDLAPGHYVFEVTACNNDGIWNASGALLAFSVPPAWYQTTLFRLLAIFSLIAISVFAYLYRLQSYAASIKLRFDERLEERTRLARDLHDTLLQTIHGSKMVAEHAREHVDDAHLTGIALDRISRWLERASGEGRAALEALRISTSDTSDLSLALRRAANDCQTNRAMKIFTSTTGSRPELHPIARDEAYRIGYEAIRNACAHSGATELWIEVDYKRALHVGIRDNGRGFDTAIVTAGKAGHFGLAGMRERALRVGGELEISSSPRSGTVVSLTIPGKVIYERSSGAHHSRLVRLFRSGRHPGVG